MIVKGNKNNWTVLDKQQGAEITAIVWFKDRVYYSDGFWVYELINGRPKKVDFDDTNPSQFALLYANDDTLICAGPNNVVRFNGDAWDSLLTPFDLV